MGQRARHALTQERREAPVPLLVACQECATMSASHPFQHSQLSALSAASCIQCADSSQVRI